VRSKLYIVTYLLIALYSCKSDKAMKFSNTVVKKYKELLSQAQLTDTKVKAFMESDNYDSIAVVAGEMENFADQKLKEVEALQIPDVNDANGFKKAVIDYFTYIKSIYTEYKNLGMAKPGRERQNAAQVVQLVISNKDSVVAQMQKIQKAFAESNGFRIQ